ncbi:MAG: N,N'-diacetyllegionaminate synthase [Parvicella sp.]|jgi:N,N'-diacetyllegionaminate synthase
MRKTLIIAEAGVNHNGSIDTAKQLIDAAVAAGSDYVKFQTFKAEDLASETALKAEYQQRNTGDEGSQFEMLKKLELSEEDHHILIDYSMRKGIKFFSTAFDTKGLDFLNTLRFDQFKSPSGEITNYPYLKKMASFGKPVILSTGMATMVEIEEAISVLTEFGLSKSQITVLHCNTEYPTPFGDVNLKAMNTIGDQFGVKVGYSDHTLGIEVPIAAVAMGATVIEKHFTLDRSLPGPDHRASLEPLELKQMVTSIRNIEKAISGDAVKKPSQSEFKNKSVARKSLHLYNRLEKGSSITETDLLPLRPGDGISPMEWNKVIGLKVRSTLEVGHKLTWTDFE